MMDSRILEHPHAQFGGMVGFPYPLGHHHVYELAGHQLQSAAASVPFSIDGLLSGSCAASVVTPAPLIPSGCGVSADTQPFKLAGRSGAAPLAAGERGPSRSPEGAGWDEAGGGRAGGGAPPGAGPRRAPNNSGPARGLPRVHGRSGGSGRTDLPGENGRWDPGERRASEDEERRFLVICLFYFYF